MPGRIAQRAFYDRLAPGARRGLCRVGRPDRADATVAIDAYRIDDAETVLVAMGTIADSARGRRRPPSRAGTPGRRRGVTAYRPFPADALWRDASGGARAVAVIERTDEPAAADNPLTRELKAALADRAARGASIPHRRLGVRRLGSRDVSAGDLVAVFDWLDRPDLADGPRWASLGIRHPSALEPAPVSLRPPGRVQPPRPLDRRARQRDDQQAAGHDHGRAVRQVRAGLSALRLRKEGPPDDVLPDPRRRADPRRMPS